MHRLAAAVRAFRSAPQDAKGAPVVATIVQPWEVEQPQLQTQDFRTLADLGYSQNVLVHACIRLTAEATYQAPLQIVGRKKKPVPERGAIARAWVRPNRKRTWGAWVEELVTTFKAGGNTFIHIRRSRRPFRVPVELWLLRNDRILPVPGSDGFLSHYEYGEGNVTYDLDPRDVIHIRTPNLIDDFLGLSEIFVMAAEGDLDSGAVKYLRGYFVNGAIPIVALKMAGPYDPEKAKPLLDAWEERYRGELGTKRPAAIGEGGDVIRLGADPKALDLSQVFGHTETRICMALGPPPILVGAWIGLLRGHYNQAEHARRHWWQTKQTTMFKRIERELTDQFWRQEFGTDLAFAFDLDNVDALQESADERNKFLITGLEKGLFHRGEARERAGVEDVDDGEVVFLKGPPVGGAEPEPKMPPDPPPPDEEDDVADDPDSSSEDANEDGTEDAATEESGDDAAEDLSEPRTWSEILARHQRVILCGRSNAGKTTLAAAVNDGRAIYNTGIKGQDGDTPEDVSFVENAYWWVAKLKDDPGPWLLEGTGGFRVVRAGLRDFGWEPDAVVLLEALHEPDDIPEAELAEDEELADEQRARQLARAKAHDTIWTDYLELRDELGATARLYQGTLVDLGVEQPQAEDDDAGSEHE